MKENKLVCKKHNIPLKIAESDDGFCNYICPQCENERFI